MGLLWLRGGGVERRKRKGAKRSRNNSGRESGAQSFVVGDCMVVPAATFLAGAATWAGRKHSFNPDLNEDTAAVGECVVAEPQRSTLLRVAWVFDGHGPQQIGSLWTPGRIVAQVALEAHQQAFARSLPAMLKAPVHFPSHPEFLTASRQAVFANTFNITQAVTRERLPTALVNFAGASATCVFSTSQVLLGGNAQRTLLMSCNLGDSRAVAVTFGRNYPPRGTVLTVEENIVEPAEILYVKRRCEELGLIMLPRCCVAGGAASGGSGASGANGGSGGASHKALKGAWAPPKIFHRLCTKRFASVEQLREELDELHNSLGPGKLRSELHGSVVYAISAPYVWKLDALAPGQKSGLQMTASIGDCMLEPLKKNSRCALDVHCYELRPRKNVTTVVIAATDGLWEAVGRRFAEIQRFAATVASWLKQDADDDNAAALNDLLSPDKYDCVARRLASWAGRKKRDDVTVTAMGFPGLELVAPLEQQQQLLQFHQLHHQQQQQQQHAAETPEAKRFG